MYLKTFIDIDLKIILFNYQNNYIRRSSLVTEKSKLFATLLIIFECILHNFNNLTKFIFNSVFTF